MKFSSFLDTIKIFVLALIFVLPIRIFIFQPFIVQGVSMEPSLETGDYLIVDEITYRLREPQRGEMVVFSYPKNPSQKYIKRIIGLPGETIEIKSGKIFVDGKLLNEDYLKTKEFYFKDEKIKLKEQEYYVLGDNRDFSFDSRNFGPVSKKYIIGRALIKVFQIKILPIPVFSLIHPPKY